jgi:hypothetical protein
MSMPMRGDNLGPINFFIVPIIHAEHSTDYNSDNRAHAPE